MVLVLPWLGQSRRDFRSLIRCAGGCCGRSAPFFDHHPGLCHALKDLIVDVFVPEPVVEALYKGVLARAVGLDADRRDLHLPEPVLDVPRFELGAWSLRIWPGLPRSAMGLPPGRHAPPYYGASFPRQQVSDPPVVLAKILPIQPHDAFDQFPGPFQPLLLRPPHRLALIRVA